MLYIGIDPDISSHSMAILNDNNELKIIYKKAKHKKDLSQETKVVCSAKFMQTVVNLFHAYTIEEKHIQPPYCAIIEGQDIRYTGHTNNIPSQPLIGTAQLAGAWLGSLCYSFYPIITIDIALPNQWKGTVRKQVCQGRAYKALDIPFHLAGGKTKYAVPDDISSLMHSGSDIPNPGDFIDISDSVALALYCKRLYGKK